MRRGLLFVALVACGRANFDARVDGSLLTYRDAVLADVPVAYYRLSDNASTTARDDTGHFDGTYMGPCTRDAPGLLVGDADGALQLDGACAVDLGDVLSFVDRQPFTIEAWFSKKTGGTTFQHIFAREARNTNPVDGYSMLVSTQSGLYAERAVATENFTTSRTPVPEGVAIHAVTVYDGSQLVLYADGVAMGSFGDTRPLDPFTTRAVIGAALDPGLGSFFVGKIDEVAVYDHVLPENRIQLHHEIGATGPIGQ